MGEDAEEKFTGVDALFSAPTTDVSPDSTSPRQVDIPKDKYMSLFQPWRGALILKLLGKSVSFRVLQQRTADLWGLQWGYELIDLEHGFFLARFFSREDYLRVLEGGPWTVMGHYLTIAKWRPNFRPSVEKISTTLVWIRFPELPIELFDEEVLTYMGDAVGKTVKVDELTMAASRGRYARVCVEIDLDVPLVPSIQALGSVQRVEYEGLHLICFGCGKYGHRQEVCPAVSKPSSEAPPPPPASSPVATDFGPWMLPRSTRRRQLRPAPRVQSDSSPTITPTGRATSDPPRPPHVSAASEEAPNPNGPRRDPSVQMGPSASPKVRHSAASPQPIKIADSRFQVLADLADEPNLGQKLLNLKHQIQGLSRPSSVIPGGSAHGPGPFPAKGRGRKGPREKPNDVSSTAQRAVSSTPGRSLDSVAPPHDQHATIGTQTAIGGKCGSDKGKGTAMEVDGHSRPNTQ